MSLSGFIAYKRVGWTGQTPWNPTNLNIMDKGIKDNNDMIANLRSEVSALNSNIGYSLKSFYFRQGTTYKITFNSYQTSALIFTAARYDKALLLVYTNGFLTPVSSDENIEASLSNDYVSITITNKSIKNTYIGILQTGNVPFYVEQI